MIRHWLHQLKALIRKDTRPEAAAKRRKKSAAPRQYLGVEALEDRTLLAVTATLSGTALDIELDASGDTATVSRQGSRIEVSDGSSTTRFAASAVQSLTALGNDLSGQSITFQDNLQLAGALVVSDLSSTTFAGTMTVGSADVSADDITLAAGATFSSRQTGGGNPNTALSTGDSGNITFAGEQIAVEAGARVLAHASPGFRPGDVVFRTEDTIDIDYIPFAPFRLNSTEASVQIGDNAVIRAGNFTATARATTARTATIETDLAEKTTAVVSGDFDGDDLPDLVTGNLGQTVNLYRNNGTATPYADAPTPVSGQLSTTSLAAADLNNDNRLDLVVGNFDEPVQVYMNNGTSAPFADVSPVNLGAARQTRAVAVGDVNNDGFLDIVAGNFGLGNGAGQVNRLYLNNRTANPFAGVGGTDIGTVADHTTGVALGDVNGDGCADLVTVSDRDPVRLYLFDSGTGVFAAPTTLPAAATNATSVLLAHVTGDGAPDLIVGRDGGVEVLTNSAGSFTVAQSLAAELPVRSLAVGRVDGDALPDLVVGFDDAVTRLYVNTGSAFDAGRDVTAFEDSVTGLALADADDDGDTDILAGTFGGTNRVYVQQPGLTFNDDDTQFLTVAPELTEQVDTTFDFGPFNLPNLRLFAAAVTSSADAEVTVGSGAVIETAGAVTLDAQAISAAELTVVGLFLGAAFGKSDADADVRVSPGARITAGGNVDLLANVNNRIDVVSFIPSLGVPQTEKFGKLAGAAVNFTLSIGVGSSESNAIVEPGATVSSGGSSRVLADNLNFFNSVTSGLAFQTGGPGFAGASLAVGVFDTEATAAVEGTLTSAADVTIDARSVNTKNITSASVSNIGKIQNKGPVAKGTAAISGIGSGVAGLAGGLSTLLTFVTGGGTGLGNPLSAPASKVGGPISKSLNLTGGTGRVGLAGALGIAVTENTATACVGDGAIVRSGNDLTIRATMTDNFQSNSSGSAGDAEDLALGGAISVGITDNDAVACIGRNATVDAGGDLRVTADAAMPNQVSIFNLNGFFPDSDAPGSGPGRIISKWTDGVAVGEVIGTVVQGILTVLATSGQIAGGIATTFAGGNGTGTGGTNSVGLGGAINLFVLGNESEASIREGARVNQNLAGQDVLVEARTRTETININAQGGVAGLAGNLPPGTSEGVGAGGALNVGVLLTGAKACIADRAVVSAGRDVKLLADTFDVAVTVAQAGSKSELLGVQGSINYVRSMMDTAAFIENEAIVTAGRDVAVEAEHTLASVNVAGGLVGAQNIGVGVSGAITDIDQTTRAFIGNANDSVGTPGSVTAGGTVTVDAENFNTVVSVAVAGTVAVASGQKVETPTGDEGKFLNGVDFQGLYQGFSDKVGAGERPFGLSISGDAAFNLVQTDAEAFIADVDVTAGGDVAVNAENFSTVVAAGGGVVVGAHTGIGGSFAFNGLFGDTEAYIARANVSAADVIVNAESDAAVVGAAASGTARIPDQSVEVPTGAVAGSVVFKLVVNDTAAEIGAGADVSARGDVSVTADNFAVAPAVAGAFSLAISSTTATLAVGAAVDLAAVATDVEATIADTARVSAGGTVEVNAESQTITADVAGALAVAATQNGPGAAGSLAVQVLVTDIDATIGAATVTGSSVDVHAEDETDLGILSGAAGGGQAAGVGASAAFNLLIRDVSADIGADAVVSGRGTGVSVTADATDVLAIFAVAGAGAEQDAAVAVSTALNVLVSDTTASIGDRAQINPNNAGDSIAQTVRVEADHTTDVVSGTGVIAIVVSNSGAGVGAAADVAILEKDVHATIGAGANVGARDSVIVSADSSERKLGLTVGGAFGGGGTGTGSLEQTTVAGTTRAAVEDIATVDADGNVAVLASSGSQIVTLAGEVGISGGQAALGGTVIALVHTDTVEASVGNDASVTARGIRGTISVPTGEQGLLLSDDEVAPMRGLAVTAVSHEDFVTTGIGLNASQAAGVAGSLLTHTLTETTKATIGERTTVNQNASGLSADQSVHLVAADRSRVASNSGTLGLAVESTGIGAGLDVGVVVKETEASVGTSALVNAGRDVRVLAFGEEDVISSTSNVGEGVQVGVAGAANVWTLRTATEAFIRSLATVTAAGNVVVGADSDAIVGLFAGGVAIGMYAGVGLSNTTLVRIDTTEAEIGAGASVTARGNRAAYDAPTGEQGLLGDNETAPVSGVSVTATSFEQLIGIAVSIGGAQNAGVAASGTVNALVDTTTATIEDGARINADNTGAGSAQSVFVVASDDTVLLGAGGSGGITIQPNPSSFGVGAGAGADAGAIIKTTEAAIDDDALVNANRDVVVRALSDELVVSVAATAGIGGGIAIGLAGAAGLHVLVVDTQARIGKRTRVTADGSVVVDADDDADVIVTAGNISGGAVGVGASLAASALVQKTKAFIADDAIVTARGNGAGLSIRDGSFNLAYVPYSSALSGVGLPETMDAVLGDFSFTPPGMKQLEQADESLSRKRQATPARRSFHGVAVTATTSDEVFTISVGGSAGAFAGITLAGAAHVSVVETNAYIGDRAQINTAGGSSEQSVLVAAGTDHFTFSLAGAAAAGTYGVGPALDAAVIILDTEAHVGQNARVEAGKDIQVAAEAQEDVLVIAAGLAGAATSSGRALVGTLSFYLLDSTTHAYLAPNVIANAGGNVLVAAQDDTDVDLISGGLAVAVSGNSMGGSIGTTVLLKDTQAFIGRGAEVNSNLGRLGTVMQVPTGTVNADGSMPSTFIHGVAVRAVSSEDVFAVAVAGAVAIPADNPYTGALAGAIAVQVVDSDTSAFVDVDARVNQQPAAAGIPQHVNVAAVNSVEVQGVVGALGAASVGGLAGGVDLGIIRNTTGATIRSGARVKAAGNVEVNALSNKEHDSVAVSAATGIAGIAGAASIYVIGELFSPDALTSLAAHDDTGRTVYGLADDQNKAGDLSGYLDGYSGSSSTSDPYTNEQRKAATQTRDQIDPRLQQNPVSDAVNSGSGLGTTFAGVGVGTTVEAGGSVRINARDRVDGDQTAGGAALGGIGFGGAATVGLVGSQTSAFIAPNATVSTSSAGSDIELNATLDEDLDGRAYAGFGGLAGIGAQVVILNDASTQRATVGNDVSIPATDQLRVTAQATRDLDAESIGATVGAYVAGVAIASATASGETLAAIDFQAQIGQQPGKSVNDVILTANNDTSARAKSIAVAVGNGLGYNRATAEVTPNATASVGAGAKLKLADDLIMTSQSTADADAEALGVNAGTLAVGVSQAIAEVSPSLSTSISDLADVNASGDIFLDSLFNTDVSGNKLNRGATADAIGAVGALTGGGTGSTADADASPNLFTTIGAADVQSDNGSIVLRSLAHRDADADARGLAVAGGLSVGVSIADADAAGQTVTEVTAFGADLDSGRSIILAASSDDEATALAEGAAGGIIAGVGVNLATATVDPTTAVRVGNDASLQAANDIDLNAQAIGLADADARGVTVSILVSVGVMQARAELTPDVDATIGDRASLQAGGNIAVHAGLGNSTRSSAAVAEAQAMGGGLLVGVNGATADANMNSTVDATVGASANLTAGGDVTVGADSETFARSTGFGVTVGGLVSVGRIDPDADIDTSTRTAIGNNTIINSGGNVTLRTSADNLTLADGEAAAGGIISSNSADTDAVVFSNAQAITGSGVRITAGQDIAIRADSREDVQSTVDGTTIGGIAVGNMLADAIVDAVVVGTVGASNSLNAGGDVAVRAEHLNLGQTAYASAEGVLGTLIGGIGSDGDADAEVAVTAQVSSGTQVRAGRDVSVLAVSEAEAQSFASNDHGALIADGNSDATSVLRNTGNALLGTGVSLDAGRSLTVRADVENEADSDATQAGFGGIDDPTSQAFSRVIFGSKTDVGQFSHLAAGDTATVEALSSTEATADAAAETLGFILTPTTRAVATVTDVTNPDLTPLRNPDDTTNEQVYAYAVDTTVTVRESAAVEAPHVLLNAQVTHLDIRSDAETDSGDGFGTAFADDADAFADSATVLGADVTVRPGVRLTGSESVRIAAGQREQFSFEEIATRAHADSDSDAVGGDTDAKTTNIQFLRATVNANSGAVIETPRLTVSSATPNVVFGSAAERFAAATVDTGDEEERRRARAENVVDFNADVRAVRQDAYLEIDAAGNIVKQRGVNVQQTATEFIVDGVNATSPGTMTFEVDAPTIDIEPDAYGHDDDGDADQYSLWAELRGSPNIDFVNTVERVTITNHSGKNLRVNDLTLPAPDADTAIRYTPNLFGFPAFIFFSFSPTRNEVAGAPTFLFVDNHGAGDVLLGGRIVNPSGTTAIANEGGDILRAGTAQVIETQFLYVHATQGDVGRGQPLLARMVQSNGVTPLISATADGELNVSLQGVLRDAGPLGLVLNFLEADALSVSIVDGVNDAGTIVRTLVDVGVLRAGADGLVLNGNQADFLLTSQVTTTGRANLFALDGFIRDAGASATPYLKAASALLLAGRGVGTLGSPLHTQVSRIEGQTLGGIHLFNTGSLTVGGLSSLTDGLRSIDDAISLFSTAALVLEEQLLAPASVALVAGGSVTQTTAGTRITTGSLFIDSVGAVGISALPLTFDVNGLTVKTDSFNRNQFLQEVNTATLSGAGALRAGSGTITLAGGTFVLTGTIWSATRLSAGTLTGTGTVDAALDARGGTVSPGVGAGILRSGNVSFDSASTFHVELNGTGLTQYDRLAVNGTVDLGGVALTGTLGSTLARGDSFTILEATGAITGQFAQGTAVTLGGVRFTIRYNANSVVLVRNARPVVSDVSRDTPEDTPLPLTAADFLGAYSDPDGDPLVSVRVGSLPAHGVLSLGGAPVMAGQEIAAASLGGLSFTPDRDCNGTTSFSWDATDGLHYSETPATFTLRVLAVNDAPINTVPGPQTGCEDVALSIGGISVADVDAGEGDGLVQVTLSVLQGALTLGTTNGLSFTTGDGSADATMTFTGTVSAINAALSTLSYLGNLDFFGSDTLTIVTNDLGNFGSGGARIDTDTVALQVLSAQQQATLLETQVTDLMASGVLSKGEGQSLLASLNLKGNKGDVGKVNSFIGKVEHLRNRGVLSDAVAQALLDAAAILLTSVSKRK